MRRRIRFVAVCALVAGAVTSGLLLGIASVSAQVEPIRLEIRSAETRGALLDFDGDGRVDVGDRFDGRSPVRDPETGDQVGRPLGGCSAKTPIVVEEKKGTWVCTWVIRLPQGHITIQGEDPAGVGPNVLAVTGGTGLYRDARGEADQVDFRRRTTFEIRLEP